MASYYVAATSGNDANDGSIGSAWKTMAHAIANTTTNDVVHLSGTDVLSSALSSIPQFLTIRNWVGGPDGVGVIDGNGGAIVTTPTNVYFESIKFQNAGANAFVSSPRRSVFLSCEFSGGTAGCISANDTNYAAIGCKFSDIAGVGLTLNTSAVVSGCYFLNGAANKFTTAITARNAVNITNNIFQLDSTSNGISLRDFCVAENNSMFSSGTGTGILLLASRDDCVANNLIHGFAVGIKIGEPNYIVPRIFANAVFGSSVAEYQTFSTNGINVPWVTNNNETLAAIPFADAANGNFEPVDTGNVMTGGVPVAWLGLSTSNARSKGAISLTSSGGGGNTLAGIRRGIRMANEIGVRNG